MVDKTARRKMVVPRCLCVQPAQFGDLEPAQFALSGDAGGPEDIALIGAVTQHRIAVATRQYLTLQRIPQQEFARQVHMTPDRLTRILRGYKPMTVFEIAVIYSVISDRDTLPPLDPVRWVDVATAAARGNAAALRTTGPNLGLSSVSLTRRA